MQPIISIRQLDFAYRESGFRLRIEELTVPAGESLALVGPSGSGKTTLLHLIAGIRLPDSGEVLVDGVHVPALSDAARRAFRAAQLGMIFQEFELLEHLSVLDNILLPYRIAPGLTLDAQVRQRARELAETLEVGDKLRRYVGRLSQGERQRVAVCRALLTQPKLLLADEPTGNLDPVNKQIVLDLLFDELRRSGTTLVTVTHDHGLLARFDRTIDFAQFQRSAAVMVQPAEQST